MGQCRITDWILKISSEQGSGALDMDEEVLHYAREQQADMIITHHPLFLMPLNQ